MPTKEVLFHQENAPVHKSVVANAAVLDCGFELVNHLPYPLIWHPMQPQTCVPVYFHDEAAPPLVSFQGHFDSFFSTIALAKLPLLKSWITVQCECIFAEIKQSVYEKITFNGLPHKVKMQYVHFRSHTE